MKASDIKYIVIHCSAGFSGLEGIEKFWKEKLGWRSPGYHRLIETDGKIHKLSKFNKQTNGVRGFNDQAIHICYIGGIELINGKYKAKDTRNGEQHHSIQQCIVEAIEWLDQNGKDIRKDLMVLGHRDFSKDKNKTGAIESYERIKECPSFDAITSYKMYSTTNSTLALPSNR